MVTLYNNLFHTAPCLVFIHFSLQPMLFYSAVQPIPSRGASEGGVGGGPAAEGWAARQKGGRGPEFGGLAVRGLAGAGYAAARDGGEGPETLEHGSRFAVSAICSGRRQLLDRKKGKWRGNR